MTTLPNTQPLRPQEIALVELQRDLVACYDPYGLLLGRFTGPLEIAEDLVGRLRTGVECVVRPAGGRGRTYAVSSLDRGLALVREINSAVSENQAEKETVDTATADQGPARR